jgi:IclR helix-turn-helix domain
MATMTANITGLTLTLNDAQVKQVMHEASADGGPPTLLSAINKLERWRRDAPALMQDARYSRSLCRALLVLAAVWSDGGQRKVTELAKELGLAVGTTRSYLNTWVALGELEQDPDSRRYRPPTSGDADAS